MTILAASDIMAIDWITCLSFCGLVSGVLIVLGIIFSFLEKKLRIGVILSTIAVLFTGIYCLCTVSFGWYEYPTGEKTYKVIINEDANIDELNEKYEVLEIEGKIYTIRERKG